MWHGSDVPLSPGTTLVPGCGMMAVSPTDPVEEMLESQRPADRRPRAACVFMVDDPQDVDNCGGNTDWLFEVRPVGETWRHDASLTTAAQCAIEDGDIQGARSHAQAYWRGDAGTEPVWEIMAAAAQVVSVERY